MDVDYAFKLDGNPLSVAYPYANDNQGRTRQGNVYGQWYTWLNKMQKQSDNLKGGYAAVKNAYPQLNGVTDIINGENTIGAQIGACANAETYLNNAKDNYFDFILDGILGNGGEVRDAFDKNLAAYREGFYYRQKQRDRDSAPFMDATAAAGLPGAHPDQIDSILSHFRMQMLNAIDDAMGVTGLDNAGNKAIIRGLNSSLINQIGGDWAQFRAVMDDIIDLKYSTAIYNPVTGKPSTIAELREYLAGISMAPRGSGKGARLTDEFNFAPAGMKPYGKGRDDEIATV
jgi:hypothetical protein